MPYQNISAVLSNSNIQALKDHAAQARLLLPFLQTLSSNERVGLYKMGAKRLAWVDECLKAAKNHPEVLPGYFKIEEFEKSFVLARALADLREVYKSLFTDMDDTTMGVGSQAAKAASDVMGHIDAAADSQPGLKSVSETLHAFFQQANVAAATSPTPTPTPSVP